MTTPAAQQLTTLGGVLVRFEGHFARGRENDLREFIGTLASGVRKLHETGERPICCGCGLEEAQLSCRGIQVIACATLTGYFDFVILLRTHDIDTLERFVLQCLKRSEVGHLIAETQTLAGCFFYDPCP